MLARFLAICALVLLNAFFVAAEFALARSRRSRLETMARAGDGLARLALHAVSNISRLLSASQLGVTLASLGLGWVAEAMLHDALADVFGRIPPVMGFSIRAAVVASAAALAIVTYFHVVFGELAPKTVAFNHAEQLARWLAPPLLFFAWLVTPFTWLLTRSSTLVLRMFGESSVAAEEIVHSPEELRILVEQSQEVGAFPTQDADMIDAVLEFSEKTVREVMTPRTELVALPAEATLEEVLATVEESGLSRLPVYEDSIDNIVGMVLAKDLLGVLVAQQVPGAPSVAFSLREVLRPVHVVPGSREVEDVLADFKRLKEHLAVVIDEYGGTAGVVTMEDLLEEIVGEILDEYDEPEESAVTTGAGEKLIPGATHVSELNERFGLELPEGDYTTVGGFVFGALGRLPAPGDRVTVHGAVLTVRAMDGRRIDSLAVDLGEPPGHPAREETAEERRRAE